MRPGLRRRRAVPTLVAVSAAATGALAQETVTFQADGDRPPERVIDIHHLRGDLALDLEARRLRAEVELTFTALRSRTDSIVFHAPGFEVAEARLDGRRTAFEAGGGRLAVFPRPPLAFHGRHRLELSYSVTRPRELYFVGFDDPTDRRRRQVWAHRPRSWLPFAPDRLTLELSITVDEGYQVFANGLRREVRANPDGTVTWRYGLERPHPFFSTCLVVGRYERQSLHSDSGVPIELWAYPDQASHAEPTYRHTGRIFAFLEQELGVPYPWWGYRQAPVADYLYSGMETTTATVFSDDLFIDEGAWWMRNYVGVNAHELVHQWYGNGVSHRSTRDTWITEGPATYYARLAEAHLEGEAHGEWLRHEARQRALSAGRTPLAHSRAGRLWYHKGSLVLQMLRDLVGDEEFRHAMAGYLERHLFGTATVEDLRAAFQEATGRPLDRFFDQWVYRGGEPHFEVSYRAGVNGGGGSVTRVRVAQVHDRDELVGLFQLPVGLRVHHAGGGWRDTTLWIDQAVHEIDVPDGGRPVEFVLFDPGHRVLKRITFERSPAELAAQARRAQSVIDRYDAVRALGPVPVDRKLAVLSEVFDAEGLPGLRAEVIAQLAPPRAAGAAPGEAAALTALVRRGLGDEHALVRRAALTGLSPVPPALRGDAEGLLEDPSHAEAELALRRLAGSFPERVHEYLERTRERPGWRHNVRIRWLTVAVQAGREHHLGELVDLAGRAHPVATRAAALEALEELGHLDQASAERLLQACTHWNHKLRRPARAVLRHFLEREGPREAIERALEGAGLSPAERAGLADLLESGT